MTPSRYLIPRTDVPVTIGRVVREDADITFAALGCAARPAEAPPGAKERDIIAAITKIITESAAKRCLLGGVILSILAMVSRVDCRNGRYCFGSVRTRFWLLPPASSLFLQKKITGKRREERGRRGGEGRSLIFMGCERNWHLEGLTRELVRIIPRGNTWGFTPKACSLYCWRKNNPVTSHIWKKKNQI